MKAMGPIPAGFAAGAEGALTLGGLGAEELIGAHGAPLFVYDRAIVARQVETFRSAFPGIGLHFAAKANPFAPLLQHMAGLVDGFDLASAGELSRVEAAELLQQGLPLSFAGPGKSNHDLSEALAAGVCVHVESEHELERLLQVADMMGQRPAIGVRVNPPFGLKGSGMKMGGLASQFGVDHEAVPALVRRIVEAGAEWRALHVYAGSQSLSAEAVIEVGSSRVDLQACKLEYSIVSPK